MLFVFIVVCFVTTRTTNSSQQVTLKTLANLLQSEQLKRILKSEQARARVIRRCILAIWQTVFPFFISFLLSFFSKPIISVYCYFELQSSLTQQSFSPLRDHQLHL